MKDSNDENPEKDNSEETPIFSDQDPEDSLKVEGQYSKGGQTPTEVDLLPQILPFSKSQNKLRQSKRLVVLLCFGLGSLGLVILFAMKPEVKEPQVAATGTKRSIPSIEGKKGPTIPQSFQKKRKEEKPSEGGILEGKKPVVSKPVKTPLMSQQKPPSGRFTINVGSFRDRVSAERLMDELKEEGYKAFVVEATIPQKGTWYRVSVGRFPSRREAQAFAQKLRDKKGIDSFVRALREAKR